MFSTAFRTVLGRLLLSASVTVIVAACSSSTIWPSLPDGGSSASEDSDGGVNGVVDAGLLRDGSRASRDANADSHDAGDAAVVIVSGDPEETCDTICKEQGLRCTGRDGFNGSYGGLAKYAYPDGGSPCGGFLIFCFDKPSLQEDCTVEGAYQPLESYTCSCI